MGKKSKRRTAAEPGNETAENSTSRTNNATTPRNDNLIPRQRHLNPIGWGVNVACLHPFRYPQYQYICIDAEKYISKQDGTTIIPTRQRARKIVHYGDCPICFKDSYLTCIICGTVSYCSLECQKAHWKLSHRKSCKPNPNLYKFKLKLDAFQGLSEDCFEGHEFLLLKPTEKLQSLQQICDEGIESANDLFDIDGFGSEQVCGLIWYIKNRGHPLYEKLVERLGFTSGRIGHEIVYGYRLAESRTMYCLLCDDGFQNQLDLNPSFYGRALFPPLPAGKYVRGNVLIYKFLLQNKQRQQSTQPQSQLLIQDDSDLQLEYVLMPMNKAELAHMLSERCKALDEGAFTTRMWRYHIRHKEQETERRKMGIKFISSDQVHPPT